MVEHLSLRVYGILVKDKQVLIIKENIKGQAIYKLPGGGLEIGEGLADCLDRELYEELGTRFTIPPQPSYVASNFIPIIFMRSYQVIPVYFRIDLPLDFTLQRLKTEEEILEINFLDRHAALDKLFLESDKAALLASLE